MFWLHAGCAIERLFAPAAFLCGPLTDSVSWRLQPTDTKGKNKKRKNKDSSKGEGKGEDSNKGEKKKRKFMMS